ncbi:MAG: hypothetical protein CVU80_00665 [Elusimicrobia bacterium HGW-Elusimicrobia-4]|nr:MAG: hypothetical protein CVU80_00665 [Elusimicrobia bacterium HGW-Elusimicrobia-4]
MRVKIYSTKLFKALGNSKRLKILLFLSNTGETCVSEISAKLGIPFLTVSRHLLKLKAAGFVIDKRKDKNIFYKCSDTQITWSFIKFIKKNFGEE